MSEDNIVVLNGSLHINCGDKLDFKSVKNFLELLEAYCEVREEGRLAIWAYAKGCAAAEKYHRKEVKSEEKKEDNR